MAHGGFLRQHSDDPELASHIMHDYTKADLDLETRGMLDFATKLLLSISPTCSMMMPLNLMPRHSMMSIGKFVPEVAFFYRWLTQQQAVDYSLHE